MSDLSCSGQFESLGRSFMCLQLRHFHASLPLIVGACVAPSTGEAGWSLPLSLAVLAG